MGYGKEILLLLHCLLFVINDLIEELNILKKGVDINNNKVAVLLYEDDLVIIAESEKDL